MPANYRLFSEQNTHKSDHYSQNYGVAVELYEVSELSFRLKRPTPKIHELTLNVRR